MMTFLVQGILIMSKWKFKFCMILCVYLQGKLYAWAKMSLYALVNK